MKNIILYGMRGSGKTTIGKLLAERLGYTFYDLDIAIQENVKIPIFKFVEEKGWDIFRKTEHEVLKKILGRDENKVIALGGGAITFENNQDILLKRSDKLIYIECPLKTIRERIEKDESMGNRRNSLTGKGLQDELEEIYIKRKGCYESFYDFKVNSTTTIETCIASILEKLPYGKICVPIIDFNIDSLREQIHKINTVREIGIVELRIDFLDNESPQIFEVLQTIKKPVIITNRSISEGGKFTGNMEQSLQKLCKFSLYGEYIDIELSAGKNAHHFKEKKLIFSYHNFKETPTLEFLIEKLNAMKSFNPYVYKIAVMPKTHADLDIIYALQEYFYANFPGTEGIFIAMGDLGRETRVNMPKRGDWVTFGSLLDSSAPGQIPYSELYDKIFN